ncbi:MAG TPA: DUF1918 domain-containing protein [Acidimicrobiales bacterium]|nr:DUF1918 domain-containing protein [Acidimicrobiales bacterium]
MQAKPGDHVVIKAHAIGQHDRDGEIVEVHGAEGGPPFVVRWADSDREVLFFPGPDATVVHYETAAS